MRKPEKYSWKPQELLTQLARIYLNLGRADSGADFVAAIAADKRSYHEGLFMEAAEACCSHLCSRQLSNSAELRPSVWWRLRRPSHDYFHHMPRRQTCGSRESLALEF